MQKTLFLSLYSILLASLLSGCASQQEKPLTRSLVSTTHSSPKKIILPKDPVSVSLYTPDKKPVMPYTIVGQAIVSRYNPAGIKRQQAIIHDSLRAMAARMGGDAIIDIRKKGKYVQGTVITYPQKTESITL